MSDRWTRHALVVAAVLVSSACGPVEPAPPTPDETSQRQTPTPTPHDPDPTPTPEPTPDPAPRPVPPRPPEPEPVPEPPPAPGPPPDDFWTGTVATWSGVGTAQVGDSVEAVSEKLGIPFSGVEYLDDAQDCGLVRSAYGVSLVVAEPGGVQYFVVWDPAIAFVPDGGGDVRVGMPVDELGILFPRWFFVDSHASLAGGPRGILAPEELDQSRYGGRAALFEALPDGTVRQYRVGATGYVLHTDYCRTPG